MTTKSRGQSTPFGGTSRCESCEMKGRKYAIAREAIETDEHGTRRVFLCTSGHTWSEPYR